VCGQRISVKARRPTPGNLVSYQLDAVFDWLAVAIVQGDSPWPFYIVPRAVCDETSTIFPVKVRTDPSMRHWREITVNRWSASAVFPIVVVIRWLALGRSLAR
jgi:hypothetical protein